MMAQTQSSSRAVLVTCTAEYSKQLRAITAEQDLVRDPARQAEVAGWEG